MKRLVLSCSLTLALVVGCAGFFAPGASAELFPPNGVFEGTETEEYEPFGIWVGNIEGSEIELVQENGEHPALSPDGLEIAYFARSEANPSYECVYLTTIDGGSRWPIYCDKSFDIRERDLSWSPDGEEVAFSAELKGTQGEAILAVNAVTEEVTIVADWFSSQYHPTWSPDGTHIAFQSDFPPEYNEFEPERGIWTIAANGSRSKLTHLISWASEPAWSPDGKEIAVADWNEEHESDEGGIALLNAETGEIEEWLLDEDGPWEYHPAWSPGGNYIFASIEPEEAGRSSNTVKLKPDGSEEVPLFSTYYLAANYEPEETATGEFEPEALFDHYQPKLDYDMQEQYFADSAEEAVDGPENKIVNSTKTTVVAAHEYPFETPSLSLLSYENAAASHGYIVEGENYEEDAAEMHALPKYANIAYGRLKQEESGHWWLQYFFYYYYDAQEVGGFGVHEGDWETVAYRLSEEGAPEEAVYSRHGSETAACPIHAVEWEMSANKVSPVVYVANGSHANYFKSGEHDRPFPKPTDDANGDGASATPAIDQVSSDTVASHEGTPEWFYWNGHWGNSEGEFLGEPLHSPESPARETPEWEELEAWAEGHEENCNIEELSPKANAVLAKPSGPREPAISAKRAGDGITIHYSVPAKGSTAKTILLSVSAKNKLDATRTKTLTLHGNHGVAHLPLPFAPGPYLAAASTYTKEGDRSQTVSVPVQP